MSTVLPKTYPDPEYEQAHLDTYEREPRHPIKPVLPPGVREADFAQAVQDFIAVVGKDAVFVDEGLSDYIDPYDVNEASETKRKVPSAAVCPQSTDQLREVLKVANKYAIPLWTFSRGKNLGYGGPAPRVNGSVALDLHLMNKIIEVNDEFHYAVVEPGVTFIDLYNYCVEHKKKVWPSTASLGWGSVCGNTLDRGMGFGSNFAHHQSMSGIEVMLADGDLVRTGQFGISNSPSAFLSKFTYGPSVEGLFLQSNLGVVTKLSIWLTPQPEGFMACTFSMPCFEDIEPMVDYFGEMRRNGTIPSSVVWFTSLIETLCISGRREDYWQGEGPVPDWRLEELRKETGFGHWYARWGLYGPKRVVQAQFDEIKEVLAKKLPTGEITGTLYAHEDGVDAAAVPIEHGSMFVGVPQLWSLPLINWPIPKNRVGKAAHGDYAPVIPSSGKAVLDWMVRSKPVCEANGVELMADFFMHERHVVLMNMFTWDQTDPVQKKNAENLYYGLYEVAKEKGYGMYRAHVNHMDLIANLNDFNGHAYNRFVEKIKDALDPNGILAPGKQGIWPNRFRHLRETQEQKKDT
ncbi:hypothetical protein B0H66DRAFT_487938 [Apodospora peruviana]|uniref:FAD-binding PCMH-type domain-containing protein n=1 Tax=Apodospora peruviana TaxID=516989 RepID=A0AAE0MET6_9PEZI|nr:hypothetical protein B0H66DRAFT_487938 [Apodospora peruviana]